MSKSAALLERLKAQRESGDLGATIHQQEQLQRTVERERQAARQRKQAIDWTAEELELKAWLDAWEPVKTPLDPERDPYRKKEYLMALFALGAGSHWHTSGYLMEQVRALQSVGGPAPKPPREE